MVRHNVISEFFIKRRSHPRAGDTLKLVWEEKLWRQYLFLVICLITFLFVLMLLIYYPESYWNDTFIKLAGIVLLGVFIWLFYSFARLRFNYVLKGGIRIGNAYFKHGNDLVLRQKPAFLTWKEIKQIELVNKAYLGGLYSALHHFLMVKTKNNIIYECTIYDHKGFIESIKKLKKADLFTKDSRYISR